MLVYPFRGKDLFYNGPSGQIYDFKRNSLHIICEGIPLEAEVYYEANFELCRLSDIFKGEIFHRYAYTDGPFMGTFGILDLSEKLVSMKNEGSINSGNLVGRGLVIDDGRGRSVRSESYLEYLRNKSEPDDSFRPDYSETELPPGFWEKPTPFVIEDENDKASFSPYFIRIADPKKTYLERAVFYNALKYHKVDWLNYLQERSISDRRPEDYSFEIKYLKQQFKALKPHYISDAEGCISGCDIERSRTIRHSKINRIYNGLSKTEQSLLLG
jgi:hypothetical protein